MTKPSIDLYTDYLLSSNGQTSATGLSSMLEGLISHDSVTRLLSNDTFNSKDLWLHVKSTVRWVEREDAVLIFDDTVVEKQYTDENDGVCWHFDHSKGRHVLGFNLLNTLYYSGGVSIPVAFELIQKYAYCELDTREIKRQSVVTKNEMLRNTFDQCLQNHLKFRYVLMDTWFSANENFEHIVKRGKHFIAPLKSNHLVALSLEDKKQGRFVRVDSLTSQEVRQAWVKGYSKEVLLTRQVFTNKDGSTGSLDLVCSDLSCDFDAITTNYQKRWQVECFHKSLKSNASLAKSPTRRVNTQTNHVFMSICAVFKLECLRIASKLKTNHFAIKSKLLITATKSAFAELIRLKALYAA
jgi:DDE superfamily endonuclease